jgi:hypothetical protein
VEVALQFMCFRAGKFEICEAGQYKGRPTISYNWLLAATCGSVVKVPKVKRSLVFGVKELPFTLIKVVHISLKFVLVVNGRNKVCGIGLSCMARVDQVVHFGGNKDAKYYA